MCRKDQQCRLQLTKYTDRLGQSLAELECMHHLNDWALGQMAHHHTLHGLLKLRQQTGPLRGHASAGQVPSVACDESLAASLGLGTASQAHSTSRFAKMLQLVQSPAATSGPRKLPCSFSTARLVAKPYQGWRNTPAGRALIKAHFSRRALDSR